VSGASIHDEHRSPGATEGRASSAPLRDEQVTQPRKKDGPIRLSLRLRGNGHFLLSKACQGETTILCFSGNNAERLKEGSIGADTSDESDALPRSWDREVYM
jgi:hypothetical protein